MEDRENVNCFVVVSNYMGGGLSLMGMALMNVSRLVALECALASIICLIVDSNINL